MTMPDAGGQQAPKLPIWGLANEAYGLVFGNLSTLASLAILPMAIGYLAWIAALTMSGGSMMEMAEAGASDPLWWGLQILGGLVGAVFVVSWHRFVLLGQRDSATPVQFRLGRRELKFFLYFVVISLPTYLGGVLSSLAGWMMGSEAGSGLVLVLALMGAFVLGVVVGVRCSFIFPALSVDADGGLVAAWRATKGVSWRLFWATCLVALPWLIVYVALLSVLGPQSMIAMWGGPDVYLIAGIQTIIGYVVYAVIVSVLSLAFMRHTGWSPTAQPTVVRNT